MGEEGLQCILSKCEGDDGVGGRVDDQQSDPEEQKGRKGSEGLRDWEGTDDQ